MARTLSQATLDAIAAAVAAAVAQAQPVRATSKSTVTRSADGRDFPCTAADPCGRMLRSKSRAAIHGVDAGGHEPR